MGRSGGCGVLAVVLLALAGCGGKASLVGSAATSTTPHTAVPLTPSTPAPTTTTPAPTTPAPTTTLPAPPAPASPLVPRGVPTHADGQPADAGDLAVVKHWLSALQHGDYKTAAKGFANGAVVINGTPPLRLRTFAERLVFNETFPCGAEVVKASSVKGYLLVTYRLTDRVGSRCDGPGNKAFGAVKVVHGRMTEWYRLPDPAQSPSGDNGPVV